MPSPLGCLDLLHGRCCSLLATLWVIDDASGTDCLQLTFMSSYSIVLAPIAALLAVDFFVVKRKRLDIYELYRPEGIYYFTYGWNWRAYIALACGVGPNLPGMIAS